MSKLYLQLQAFLQGDSPLVLATVTGVVGSTPQKPGSSALFGRNGLVSGTVGGGILEGEVQKISSEALSSKRSGHYIFKLDGEISRGDGAICGGQAEILIDASPEDHLEIFKSVNQSISAGIPGVLVTKLISPASGGARIERTWFAKNGNRPIQGPDDTGIANGISHLLQNGRSGDCMEWKVDAPRENPETRVLLQAIFPPPRLVIAGAGHIGKALSHLGKLLDFEVTVIDDRPDFANQANLPDADHIVNKDVGLAMEELKKDPNTFIVIVTRGHKDDAKALKSCIGSSAAYVGMIGRRRKIAQMRNDFLEHGWTSAEGWETIHAPIGLDIHSVSVQEIAISIAAQLIKVKNSKQPAYV